MRAEIFSKKFDVGDPTNFCVPIFGRIILQGSPKISEPWVGYNIECLILRAFYTILGL